MTLENARMKVQFIPQLGGKIFSLYDKKRQFEFAALPGQTMENIPAADSFAPYAYGMDDAFPNIDKEPFVWNGRKLSYPDHGEIWSAGMNVEDQRKDSVSLHWESSEFGYHYHRQMQIIGDALHMKYHITNLGEDEFPCIWTWHGLMKYAEDMEIIFPAGTSNFRNVLGGSVLGNVGEIYPFENTTYDFTKVPKSETESMVKFYVEGKAKEGRCGFRYPSSGAACILEYDKDALPYLGVWITAGGFQGDYNCALEPTNGFYDSISTAHKNGVLPVLKPGESIEFVLKITLA